MKVTSEHQAKRASWQMRLFRFWFPIFLFAYLSFVQIVWLAVPIKGPIATIGHIVPVPVASTEGVGTIWYRDVLRMERWYSEAGQEMDKKTVLTWTAFRHAMEKFADDMDVEREGGIFSGLPFGEKQDLFSLHNLVVDSVSGAQERGLYQAFALERVERIQNLIDFKIYFPDLAYQYSDLPSRTTNGTRTLTADLMPDAYAEAIGSDTPVLVETPTHYVFVRAVELNAKDASGATQYRVTELGVKRQGMRETLYGFLVEHPVHWY